MSAHRTLVMAEREVTAEHLLTSLPVTMAEDLQTGLHSHKPQLPVVHINLRALCLAMVTNLGDHLVKLLIRRVD